MFLLLTLLACTNSQPYDTGLTISEGEHVEAWADAMCDWALVCEERTGEEWFTRYYESMDECREAHAEDWPAQDCAVSYEASQACRLAVLTMECGAFSMPTECLAESICL
jgi:hypothetical protein